MARKKATAKSRKKAKKAPAAKKAAKKAPARTAPPRESTPPRPPRPTGGPPPIPPDQRPLLQYKNPRQPPREESVKPQRPAPGRFHPGRGDLGGRG